jgi:ribosomal protein S18 acetylase RimI-like enzyme
VSPSDLFRDLPSDLPGDLPGVRLDPITWDELDVWSEQSVGGFAARLVSAGLMPPDEAAAYARRQLDHLLPEGIATPLHLLRTVREPVPGEPVVGHVWTRVAPGEPPASRVEAYLFDIDVVEEARGRGIGTAIMRSVEQVARDLGAEAVRLTVFAEDVRARRMYDRLGYAPDATHAAAARDNKVTAWLMTKGL